MAQVSVTFQVDMNNETVSGDGVHVAGNWQMAAGFDGDWDPSLSELTDDDADGIYTLTVDLPAGDYQYKYINGNAWGSDENAIPSQVASGGNRFFAITDWHATDGLDLPAVQFNQAGPAGTIAVRLVVSMANETVSEMGVHVAGPDSLIGVEWTPEYGTTSNTGPDEYAFVAYVDEPGDYQYKFINGNTWLDPNESVPDDCGTTGNRIVEVGSDPIATPAYCYNACEPCSEPNVTLTVDLTNEDVDNGGFVAGDFNGWGGVAMEDNGDGTYTSMLSLAPGTYSFKFQNGLNGWEDFSGPCIVGGNRQIVVEEGVPLTYVSCFSQCTEECVANPDPADITFQVDMNNETVAPEGVFLIAAFAGWQGGAIEMLDGDGDGVYEATAEVSGPADMLYKFVNGDVSMPENEEFQGNTEQLSCNVPSGQELGWNRIHTRSGEPETLGFVFNTCDVLSVNELELGRTALFPNPSNGTTYLEVENPNGFTLRMNIVDITGKLVRENVILNDTRNAINTSNLNAGMYFLNVVNQSNETAVFKLLVQ